MSLVPQRPGGWWHDFVCPTHGIELAGRDGDHFVGPCGCRVNGEKFDGAALALEHQDWARRARVHAHRFAHEGAQEDRAQALRILGEYAQVYAHITSAGWSERSEPWMLRGKLFAQALSEAQWAVGIADAVVTLGPVPECAPGSPVATMLRGMRTTLEAARVTLVHERDDQRNNYTAWLDAGIRLVSLASRTIGDDGPTDGLVDRVYAHIRLAVLPDGWEWEASTYYHVFVLRAYLLALRGVDPATVPADVMERLRAMVDVLVRLAAPDGFLPALHDGPYDRIHMHREVLEIAVLAAQLMQPTGLGTVEKWVRDRLGDDSDGLEDLLTRWFDGAPCASVAPDEGSHHFRDAGYVVLREGHGDLHAVIDAGPHGGAHGHLDKLGLYVYGSGVRWQPAPGVPPYASPLRHGYYARSAAHPTVTIDGQDQRQASAIVEDFDAAASRVRVRTTEAVPGVDISRSVRLVDGLLIDVVRVRCTDDAAHEISLGWRPAVDMAVQAHTQGWRTQWTAPDGQALVAEHRGPVGAAMVSEPGRGPSDDPSRLVTVAQWTVTAPSATFVTVISEASQAAAVTDLQIYDDVITIDVATPGTDPERYEVA